MILLIAIFCEKEKVKELLMKMKCLANNTKLFFDPAQL
jgi:hypothetical protein